MKKNKNSLLKCLFTFLTLSICSILISSCSRDIKNLEDLKEISFEENPTLMNGFRLGYQPDSIGFRFRHYNIDQSPRYLDAFCLKCKKWRHKEGLRLEDKHSWGFILHDEGFGPNYLRLPNLNGEPEPAIIKTRNPNVYYIKEGNNYIRQVNAGDNFAYLDNDGNAFLEDEPIIYFKQPEGISTLWSSKGLPKGVYGSCIINGDFGKDTILTEFEINFKSENHPPISRLIFTNSENLPLYEKGDIVDFTANGFDEYYMYDCKESYIAALNQEEVEKIISYFEKKFGKKKYKTRARSDKFNRPINKSFYREYRWSVGIVNIILTIDDYPPTNCITSDFENPYNQFGRGYSANAKFLLNDKVLKIIEKEN